MTVTDASTSIPQQEQRQKQRRTRTQRVWEVDALRGLAVVMMVVTFFDGSWAAGARSSSLTLTGIHCQAPAGLFTRSQS